MKTLIKNISSLVTIDAQGKKALVGKEMQNISEIKNAAILFDEKILWVGTNQEANEKLEKKEISAEKILDARGKTIIPGFVDSHTHIVFAGNRSEDFARRLRGVSYQQIASEGGGILRTMIATRAATLEELVEIGTYLGSNALKHGTTAIEIKSGYGLTLESEIKQLQAIKELKKILPLRISTTFMGAHDFPPEYKNNHQKYIDLLCEEMLPKVAEENLAEFCDVFIDEGYYTIQQGEQVLQKAAELGFKLKVHADELSSFGAAELAAKLGAVSADHLLFISDQGIEALRKAGTVATLLPGVAYFLRMQYAPARKIIEKNAICALASDCNPGSSFTENMQQILSLSVTNMQMSCEEALVASTLNGAAALLKSNQIGSLEIGKSADFSILNIPTYIDLFYHFGINHVESTWIKGKMEWEA